MKHVLLIVFSIVVAYMTSSFVHLDADPESWGPEGRIGMLGTIALVMLASFTAAGDKL